MQKLSTPNFHRAPVVKLHQSLGPETKAISIHVPLKEPAISGYGNDITAAELAVDCQIEHGQVASAAFDLKFRPD
jgi:hypothetical protein